MKKPGGDEKFFYLLTIGLWIVFVILVGVRVAR